jgi:protein SCO1
MVQTTLSPVCIHQRSFAFSSKLVFAVCTFITSLIIIAGFSGCDTYEPPTIYGEIGAFSLTSTSEEHITKSSLIGKLWVGHLFFSRCPSECPRMFRQLQALGNLLQEQNVEVGFLSLSEVLKEYSVSQNLQSKYWLLLTGDEKQIRSFATKGLKLAAPEDPSLHSARFVLIDQKGKLRGFYLSTQESDMEKLKRDIVAIARD